MGVAIPDKRVFSRTIYVSLDMEELWNRMEALAIKTKVPVSRQVLVCALACIDTMEKEMPDKRSFMLNGCKVMP